MSIHIIRFGVGLLSLVVALGFAGAANAETPSQEQLYKMLLELQQKTERLEKEAAAAEAEAAKNKAELNRLKQQLEAAKGGETVKPSASVASKDEPVSRSAVSARQEKGGFITSFEYLYWKPALTGLDYAILDPYRTGNVRGAVKSVDPDQDAGYRFTLGYHFRDTKTDVRFKWTGLESKGSSVLYRGSNRIWGIRLHPNAIINDDDVTMAQADYRMDYDVYDLELGYTHRLTPSADIRYFGGLRKVDMTQKLNILYVQDVGGGLSRRVTFKEENHLDGLGPRVGLEGKYYLGKGFSLFAGGAASLMISDMEYRVLELNRAAGATTDTTRAEIDQRLNEQFIPGVDFDLGIAWEYPFGQRGSVTMMAGYHYENWFNVYHQMRFSDDVDSQLGSYDTSDVAIHGPTFKLNVTF